MGVRGLKSFIEKNDGLLIQDYHLHDTSIVIDACNLISVLARCSQKHERRDLFGGDMVQFGHHVSRFFEKLQKCQIKPILVFDGAQTQDSRKSKTKEKLRRALERFDNVKEINYTGSGDYMLPVTATNVFRSIAIDKGIELIQCMFEADTQVARLANNLQCPVVSNDSDFYLMDLPYGLIIIDLMDYESIATKEHDSSELNTSTRKELVYYIKCQLFKQELFKLYLPSLDKKTLPILGILAGNDFVDIRVFSDICQLLPPTTGSDSHNNTRRRFRNVTNRQHNKISRILCYLNGKSIKQLIEEICCKAPRDKRAELRRLIEANLAVYELPDGDEFIAEIARVLWRGYCTTYRGSFNDYELMKEKYEATVNSITSWLKEAMEKSLLSYRCLEIINRNNIFIQPYMDDNRLASARQVQIRTIAVILSLTRSSYYDSRKCIVFDRIGVNYGQLSVRPLKYLEHFGKLNYLIYDVPLMTREERLSILFATFHCPVEVFFKTILTNYVNSFETRRAEEYAIVQLLMDSLDCSSPRLTIEFRHAVWLTIVFYMVKHKTDKIFLNHLEDDEEAIEFMDRFASWVKRFHYEKQPQLSKQRRYSSRLMHQITQLESALVTFNTLNSFLGDMMVRLRPENWLNPCLIYNLVDSLRTKQFKLTNLPEKLKYFHVSLPRTNK